MTTALRWPGHPLTPPSPRPPRPPRRPTLFRGNCRHAERHEPGHIPNLATFIHDHCGVKKGRKWYEVIEVEDAVGPDRMLCLYLQRRGIEIKRGSKPGGGPGGGGAAVEPRRCTCGGPGRVVWGGQPVGCCHVGLPAAAGADAGRPIFRPPTLAASPCPFSHPRCRLTSPAMAVGIYDLNNSMLTCAVCVWHAAPSSLPLPHPARLHVRAGQQAGCRRRRRRQRGRASPHLHCIDGGAWQRWQGCWVARV